MVFPKAFANLMATRGDYKILSMKSKDAGTLNVEIIPCNSEGKEIDPKSIQINDPERDLINKTVNFLLKINDVKGLNPAYEDVYCQFSIFNDPTLYRTETVKGNNGFNFKFCKQFTFTATPEFIDFLLHKTLFIQVWSEQKHTKPDPAFAKVSTSEYFESQNKMNNALPIVGKEILNNVRY
jgi:hypothetical protein